MADLLPSSPDSSVDDGGEPKVVGVDSDDADDLLAALQSETARNLLAALYDDPATPSALAEELDTSIQNVRYHLDRLTDADLVEVADTVYSEKGREMKVYAPAAKPLVVFAGNDDETSGVEAALARLLGGLGILGLSSLAVQRLFGGPDAVVDPSVEFQGGAAHVTTDNQNASASGANDDAGVTTEAEETATTEAKSGVTTEAEGDAATETTRTATGEDTGTEAAETTVETTAEEAAKTTTVEETAKTTTIEDSAETTHTFAEETARTVTETAQPVTKEAAETTTAVAEAGGAATSGLPPGLLFFAGGLVVLLALGVTWYLRAR